DPGDPRPARSGVPRRPRAGDERATRPHRRRTHRDGAAAAQARQHLRAGLGCARARAARAHQRRALERRRERRRAMTTSAPRRRRRSVWQRKALRRALPWIVIIAIFVLWELVVDIFRIEQFILPAPSAIFASGWQWRWPILDNAWQTFMTTAVGFAIA